MKKTLLVFWGLIFSVLFLTTNGHTGYVITQIADSGSLVDMNDTYC